MLKKIITCKKLKNEVIEPEYADERYITQKFGLGYQSLYNLRKAGLIRSASTMMPGQTRGKRTYHVQSIRNFLLSQEEREPNQGGGSTR